MVTGDRVRSSDRDRRRQLLFRARRQLSAPQVALRVRPVISAEDRDDEELEEGGSKAGFEYVAQR